MMHAKAATGGALTAGLMIAMIGAGTAVHAADLGGAPRSRPPAYEPAYRETTNIERWTGFHVGATYGASFGDIASTGFNGALNAEQSGSLATIYAGMDWQIGNAVVGVEADYGGGWVDGSSTGAFGGISTDLQSTGSVRARAGLLLTPALLAYGTVGWTWADYDLTANGFTNSQVFDGYQLGLGAEYMVASNVSIRLEYLYSDFGTETVNHGGGLSNTYDVDSQTIRAGIGLRF